MKLRIRDNSLRLRLTVTEVGLVADGQPVGGHMPLPGGQQFGYRLTAAADTGVTLADNRLTVTFPAADLRVWAASGDVSLTATVVTGDDTLNVLVEKDFACLAPRPGSDDADTFEHPRAGHETC